MLKCVFIFSEDYSCCSHFFKFVLELGIDTYLD